MLKKATRVTFGILSLFLLISLGLNPISSNPQNGLFPLAYAISDPVISSERAGNYLTERHLSGIYVTTIGLPNLVQDDNGQWINAVVSEDDNFIRIDSRTPSYISKNDCKLNLLDFDTESSIVETHYGKWQKGVDIKGTTQWSDFNISDLPCYSHNSFNNETGSFIEYSQKNDFMELKTIIAFYTDKHDPESFIIPKLLKFADNTNKTLDSSQIPEITDKFRIIHVVESEANTVKIDEKTFVTEQTVIKEEQSDGTKLNLFETKQTESVITKPIVEIDYGDEKRITDYTKETERLSEIQLTNVENKVVTEAIFEKDGFTLNIGESKTYDPTFSSSNPTVDGLLQDEGNNNSCDGNSLTKVTNSNNLGGYLFDTGSSPEDCQRAFIEWSLSGLPTSGFTVIDTDFSFDVEEAPSNARNGDFMAMTTARPSTATNADIWTDMGNGAYVTNDSTVTTSGNNKSVDLGTTADSDVQSQSTLGWFAIAYKLTNETLDGSIHQARIASEETAGVTPAPTLTVTYVIPIVPSARTGLSVGSATTSTLTASWTNPTNYDNATQPSVLNQTLYRGSIGYPSTELKNGGGADSGSLTGALDMSALGNTLLAHWNETSSYVLNDTSTNFKKIKTYKVATQTSDDFSTCTASTFTNCQPTWSVVGTDFAVDTTNDEIDFGTETSLSDTGIASWDFGDTVCDTKCVVRIEQVNLSTANQYGTLRVYLSSLGTTGIPTASQDSVGFNLYDDHLTAGTDIFFNYCDSDGATHISGCTQGAGTKVGATDFVTGVNYYFEIIIDGTNYTVEASRTSFDTAPFKTHTSTHTATGLRYLNLAEGFTDAAGTNNYVGTIQKIYLYDGVTSVSATVPHKFSTLSVSNGVLDDTLQFPTITTAKKFANFTNSNLGISGTNSFTLASFVLQNDTSLPVTLLGFGTTTATGVRFIFDEDSVAINKGGTDLLNKTISPTITEDTWQHIAFTSNATHKCAYLNATLLGCTADTTTLGSPSEYVINANGTKSGNFAPSRFDETVSFSTALSWTNIDYLFRHGIAFVTKAVTGISSSATSQQDTGLTASTSYCYQVSATNSAGESTRSNVDCESTSAASSGGGGDSGSGSGGGSGGGGGGGGSGRNSGEILLSVFTKATTLTIGETKSFTLNFEWEKTASQIVKLVTIEIGSGSFDSLSIVPESLPADGKTIEGGKGEYKITVASPDAICNVGLATSRCVKLQTYQIPVTITVTNEDGTRFTKQTTLSVTIQNQLQIGTMVIIAIAAGTGFTIWRLQRSKKKTTKHKEKSPKQHKKDYHKVMEKVSKEKKPKIELKLPKFRF